MALSGTAALLLQSDVWMSAAAVALAYYSTASLAVGRGFGVHWLDPRRVRWVDASGQNLTPRPTPNRMSWLEKLLSRTVPPLSITGEG
jgi:hypothetical protein